MCLCVCRVFSVCVCVCERGWRGRDEGAWKEKGSSSRAPPLLMCWQLATAAAEVSVLSAKCEAATRSGASLSAELDAMRAVRSCGTVVGVLPR